MNKHCTDLFGHDLTPQIDRLRAAIDDADAILIGAGAGLSTAAGFRYDGPDFERDFADFHERFGIEDMYSGGFYPFPDLETYWAWWSRMILINRYDAPAGQPYLDLLDLVRGRDYFVLTTNVDHQFQKAGFDRGRLFYTQGDYGLFQCSGPCHARTYDNETAVREMAASQRDLRVPEELVPHCPVCGRPMMPNLRADASFVEDEGWHRACERYQGFVARHGRSRVLLIELGVGGNTPGIIKYPFWHMTADNPQATYACLNLGEAGAPAEIAGRSIVVNADVADVLGALVRR
ncbi:SIR2 family NAD-dependent protein deacylase [Bifidobacterium samirii]|uniref:Sir2 silent information regulator family NAD-dependent deacetylase n=1 Tax=Bifidobacterium samirii TaxID=2306974 RepID=A0A430FUR5_9BIFI|nr:Sir2 silent information regulator family NAD-dependent deacetylase [Bifidobacterium samirii]RSX57208.1 Sir2 silent information regulator family NAD-dependent deacetylase [Bifidobacterium samirii]